MEIGGLPGNGWSQYEKLVIFRLNGLDKKVDQLVVDVAALKVKAGVWGLIGGLIPVLVTIAIFLLKG